MNIQQAKFGQSFKFTIMVAALLILSSCGVVLKTAYGVVKGASSEIEYIQPVKSLQSYNSLDVALFTSAVGNQFSPSNLTYLDKRITSSLTESGVTQIKGGELKLIGTVIYVDKGKLSNKIVVQVKFNDTKTDENMGIVNITGEVSGMRDINSSLDAIVDSILETLFTNSFTVID